MAKPPRAGGARSLHPNPTFKRKVFPYDRCDVDASEVGQSPSEVCDRIEIPESEPHQTRVARWMEASARALRSASRSCRRRGRSGLADVLCSDKTGTLTQNALTVTSVVAMHGFDEPHILALAEGNSAPVLVISGLAKADDRVHCLKAGGDDYLVKPFSMHELSARIEALLRRASDSHATYLRAGRSRWTSSSAKCAATAWLLICCRANSSCSNILCVDRR